MKFSKADILLFNKTLYSFIVIVYRENKIKMINFNLNI